MENGIPPKACFQLPLDIYATNQLESSPHSFHQTSLPKKHSLFPLSLFSPFPSFPLHSLSANPHDNCPPLPLGNFKFYYQPLIPPFFFQTSPNNIFVPAIYTPSFCSQRFPARLLFRTKESLELPFRTFSQNRLSNLVLRNHQMGYYNWSNPSISRTWGFGRCCWDITKPVWSTNASEYLLAGQTSLHGYFFFARRGGGRRSSEYSKCHPSASWNPPLLCQKIPPKWIRTPNANGILAI